MRPPSLIQRLRDLAGHEAYRIRVEVNHARLRHRDEGSLAWELDKVRLAWADLLFALSGWAQ